MSSVQEQEKQSTVYLSKTKVDFDDEVLQEWVALRGKVAYVSGLLEGLAMKESLSEGIKSKLKECINTIK